LGDLESEAQLRRLVEERYRAIESGDFAAFAALCHPDLLYVHTSGLIDSLGAYLAKCRDGYYQYSRVRHTIENLTISEGVALVLGGMQADLLVDGQAKTLDSRVFAVWVRPAGTWMLLAHHPAPALPPAATS
jgi:ketosteroid isomerase-like protein